MIQIKTGSSVPTTSDLNERQIGYDSVGQRLYIRFNDQIIKLGAMTPEEINAPTHLDLINSTSGLASEQYVDDTIQGFFENGILPPSLVTDLSNYDTKTEVDTKIEEALDNALGILGSRLDGINGEIV
jgi:hypothetical protein